MVVLDKFLYVVEPYGPIEPSALTGPVKSAAAKYGSGLTIEEGTTNLVINPSFETGTTGYSGANGATVAQSSQRSLFGDKSLMVTHATAGGGTSGVSIGNGVSGNLTLASSTTYTYSVWIWIPSTAPHVLLSVQGAGLVSSTVNGNATTVKEQWQRLSITFTTVASVSAGAIYVLAAAATTAGQTFYIDGVQVEQKEFATSYCDGSMASDWNASGNLLSSAASSFEDGTTASWTNGGNVTVTNSTAQAYSGTRSLLATMTATTALFLLSPNSVSGVPVMSGKTYSASLWVRPSAAKQLILDIIWYNSAGAVITTTGGAVFTGVATTWQKIYVTAIAPALATYACMQFRSSDAASGGTYYIDAARIEEGTEGVSYRWNGAENASTSTRVQSILNYAIDTLASTPITIAAFFTVTKAMYGKLAAGFPEIVCLSDGTTSNRYFVYMNVTSIYFPKQVSGTAVSPQVVCSPAVGDIIGVALTFDGTNVIGSVSKNGGSVQRTTTASSTQAPSLNLVNIGTAISGVNHINTAIEQVLIYNRALSNAEVDALLVNKKETTYESSKNIVFALATGRSRNTINAITKRGVGFSRISSIVNCAIERVSIKTNPDDDGATYKITVPAGTGISRNQKVALGAPGNQDYTVRKVHYPGGLYEELYI